MSQTIMVDRIGTPCEAFIDEIEEIFVFIKAPGKRTQFVVSRQPDGTFAIQRGDDQPWEPANTRQAMGAGAIAAGAWLIAANDENAPQTPAQDTA